MKVTGIGIPDGSRKCEVRPTVIFYDDGVYTPKNNIYTNDRAVPTAN
jgi:hypothetical protein